MRNIAASVGRQAAEANYRTVCRMCYSSGSSRFFTGEVGMRKGSLAFGVVAVLLVGSWAGPAHAQSGPVADEVDPTAKGIIGCALLGAEASLIVESVAGVRNGWALGLIPVATGIGGGIGGYFLEQNADAEWSVATLVAGMALVIPTTIIVLKATAYSSDMEGGWVDHSDEGSEPPPASDSEETTVERTNEAPPAPAEGGGEAPPPADGGGGTEAPPEGGATPPGPSSLLQITPGTLSLGVPSIGFVGSYSTAEVRRFGLTQRTELRIPLLTATF